MGVNDTLALLLGADGVVDEGGYHKIVCGIGVVDVSLTVHVGKSCVIVIGLVSVLLVVVMVTVVFDTTTHA